MNHQSSFMPGKQRGLTLVELLVAMVISLIVAIAAVSSLLISRQGFSSVDATSQLRDNARFSIDLIQRLGVQAGYDDVQYAATTRPKNNVLISANPATNVYGFNNAMVNTVPADRLTSSTAWASTTTVGYGSDVLILRYQASETFPGSMLSDRTMIDCTGTPGTAIPADLDDRMISILSIAVGSDGEPSLMCTTGTGSPQPIVQGVENFQVLYGVDNVSPLAAPTGVTDSVPDRYLRADQLTVAGDPVGTNANWRRIRSLRIGMVLRGALGSAPIKTNQNFYPFGLAKDSAMGSPGSAMSSANDPGTVFTAGADGRLRQVVTFTIHLRNDLSL